MLCTNCLLFASLGMIILVLAQIKSDVASSMKLYRCACWGLAWEIPRPHA